MYEIIRVMIDELETVIKYKGYEESAECPLCKQTIHDITLEEFTHVGEALGVLKNKHPDVWDAIMMGIVEVNSDAERMDKLNPMI